MALGQFNANLSCAHLLAAKGVLCYLLDTLDFALEYNFSQQPVGPLASVLLLLNCVFTDVDWASNEMDHRSILGYAFSCFHHWLHSLLLSNIPLPCL